MLIQMEVFPMGLRSSSSIRLIRSKVGNIPAVANEAQEPDPILRTKWDVPVPGWVNQISFAEFLNSGDTEGTLPLMGAVPRLEMKKIVERLRQIFVHHSNGQPRNIGEQNMSMHLKQSFGHVSYMNLSELWKEPAVIDFYMIPNISGPKLCHIFSVEGSNNLAFTFYDEALRLPPERKLLLASDIKRQLAELAQAAK
jgi:hypothetical protein